MRKFQIRQGILKFNCICKVCKNGPAVDKADFDEYDKIMQDHENLLRDYNLNRLDYQTICICSLSHLFWRLISTLLKLERSIFQKFWKLHYCAKFLFIELEASNFGYLLIFWFSLTVQSFSKIGQHWY